MKLFRRPDTFDPEMQRTCLTCATKFTGRYCSQCGEKVLVEGEESLKVFFAEILNAFTFLDGKFIRSFRVTLRDPGTYTRDYSEGIRVPYMKPVSFFFVANFIFFLFPFITSNTLSTPLRYQHQVSLYGASVPAMIEEKLATTKMDRAALEEVYNSQSVSLTKLLIVILVFMFAILFSLVNFKRSLYFANHLYFAFEFTSFFLFVNMIMLSVLVTAAFYVAHWLGADLDGVIGDNFFTWVFALTTLYFLIRGLRTYYRQKWVWAIGKSLLIIFCATYVFTFYKALLFYLTMWTI
jgi:hypothetical protein